MTSTVLDVLLGTYTRSGSAHKGHGTVPDRVLAYTLKAGSGRLVGWTSAPGSSRAGCRSCGGVPAELVLIGGAVQTTANTTAAGLKMATTKTTAKKIRKTRDRMVEPSRAETDLFVG